MAKNNPCRPRKTGFTLIELLVVIAIIALLAAILFPVFTKARERAKVSVCSSNLRQFMLGINMYTQDYDEGMPFAWKIKGQIGQKITEAGEEAAGKTPQGLWVSIMPYVKSQDIFKCPSDVRFWGDKAGNRTIGVTVSTVTPGKYTYYQALGQSYKFTKDNFTLPPEVGNLVADNNGLEKGTGSNKDRGDMMVAQAGSGSPVYEIPPMPMRLNYFARPSETRVIRDFNAPWEEFADTPNGFEEKNVNEYSPHRQGINIAFADGHVKFITSKATYNQLCDGPTLSPARNSASGQPFSAGDGSCNTLGQERRTP